MLVLAAVSARAQSTFNITSATYGPSAATSIPAGIGGVTLELGGTLPTSAQQAAAGLQGCFYTGYGSTAGLPLSAPDSANTEPLTVPASTIQAIPTAQFTAANNYAVTAYVYFIGPGATCDGTTTASLTNKFPVSVVAPSLGAYVGPTAIPQTNSATSVQAAPLTLTLPASGIFPPGSTVATTTVLFGTTAVTPTVATLNSLTVPVPASFASSTVGSTASLQVCNTFGSGTPLCITPTPAITLTVTALVASSGTVTATPNPVAVTGQTVLTAQFTKSANAAQGTNPGAPSGIVTFTADDATVAPAPLVLDTTATFASQTSSVTAPTAPTPTITPAAGSYTGAQTITIADSDPAATIYYTQDGSTPTNGSTLYSAPFSIAASQTIKAIAAVPGDLNSAVASVTYTVIVRPPTHLAFQVQPVNTALNTAITPAVQVALLDSTNAVAAGATNAVTIAIGANPANGILSGTKTVNAVNGIATFNDLSIAQLGTGYTLRATSGSLTGATSNAFNITPPAITLTVQATTPAGLVGVGATLPGSFTLGAPAPAGGLTVNLSSGTPANVTISPATVTVAAGATTGSFTYTGVATGSSTLSASATGYQTGTIQTTATAAQVSLGVIPAVGPGQTQSLALSLPPAYPAPPGGTTVTFTIANANIATVTSSVFIPAGQFTAASNPQVAGVLIGTTTVTANAPGYAPATRPVTVTVTAAFNPGTTNINLITSTNTVLQISAPAPAGGIKFNLSSDDTSKVTVPASVTVVQGGTTVKVPITGVADGSTTIRATSPGITEADGTVQVNSTIVFNDITTGYDIQVGQSFYFPVAPSVPTNVTIKVSDPTVAVISTSSTAVGQQTIVLNNITQQYIGTLYIQGKKAGTTTLTISAPGYTTGTGNIKVLNTGFAYYYGNGNFTTTTYASPTTETIYPFLIDPTSGSITGYQQQLSPGTPTLSVPVTSSDTTIGTVTSPVVFHALDGGDNFTFTPVAAGTTNLVIGTQPTGFTVPMANGSPQYQTAVATVNTPAIVAPSDTTGVHLQNGISIYLPVAPPSGVTVTVTSSAPGIATLSKSQTVAGTATQTFTNVTSAYVGTLYVQGQGVGAGPTGTSTITVSAPGYTSGTNTLTVTKAGFAYYYGNNVLNTTSFSGASTLTVYPFLLDTNQGISGYPSFTINPGVGPITVPLTNSDNTVGTISTNSLTFNTNDNYQQFTFQPVGAGTDNITIGTVAGFTTPSNYQQTTATVTAPAINLGGQTTGVHFQQAINVYLPVAPPSARTVTITSGTPGVVTLAKDNVTVGTGSVTFTGVTGTYVGTIYVQGQSAGTATLTETASGYTSGTSTINVYPSGFGFIPGYATFNTTTFSSPTTVGVYPLILNPNGNGYAGYGYPLNPGVGPVTVPITDSNTPVGTISTNAVVFNTNDTYQQFTFTPVSAGTTNLAIGTTPVSFTTPSNANSVSGTVTVSAPAIQVNNQDVGLNFEIPISISLPQTPPNPVTVTVTSNGPLFGVFSNSATTVGTNTVTFTNVTSTNVGTVYLQGTGVGGTTYKVVAPGYTDGTATITVHDSGFAFYYNQNFTTSVGNNPSQITVYPVMLNHSLNTIYNYSSQYIAPQIGTVSVPETSSNTSVGTVNSPITFAVGASYAYSNFTPVASGTATITLGTPTGFTSPSQNTTATATVQ